MNQTNYDRSVVSQRGEKSFPFLKYYRLIRRAVCRQYELKDADLELLIYLEDTHYFTRNDFETGVKTYTWDKHRFKRLVDEGWIVKAVERKKGIKDNDKYKLTRKSRSVVNHVYRCILGEDDIAESERRNPQMKKESYSDKVYSSEIKRFNRRKDG